MVLDDTHLPELTARQEEILSLVVHAYTKTPEPISSKHLVDSYSLGVSSATIRNEMATLEELGYIAAPHKSSGRVPTENGYRYFVKRLLHDNSSLTNAEEQLITNKLQSMPLGTEQWMRLVATVLSRTAQTAALVTPPIAAINFFKHVELIAIQGRLALLVLVLQGGAVHQRMLNLFEPVSQETLSETATHINALCADLTADEVRIKSVQLEFLGREAAELIADLMEYADRNQVRLIYRDGLTQLVDAFHDSVGAQQAIRVFEERIFLNTILAEIISPMMNNVQVVIAGEGRWEELSHLSMVLSRYGVPGQASGTVGLLGPTHINYGRAISTVRYVSTLMTDLLVDLYEAADVPDDR